MEQAAELEHSPALIAAVSSPGQEDEAPTQPCDKQENQQMAVEFNIQRAKMKELFLQKEEEVKRVVREKQQLESQLTGLRQQLEQLETLSENQRSEIETLQFLVHETVEASSSESGEVRQLRARCMELEQQLGQLGRQQVAASQELSLAPSVLVAAVTKSIARKLGAEQAVGPESLDDSMKKAQEDAELLRSLVVPLEEEIAALKEKLRSTDTQLQIATQNNRKTKSGDSKGGGGAAGGAGEAGRCDMCANYEAQLVAEQAKCAEAGARARRADLALKMATSELEQAAAVHADAAAGWQAERAAAAAGLAALRVRVEAAERALEGASAAAASSDAETLQRLTELTVHRETLQERLDSLERENETLVGKYVKKAAELQSEDTSLPDDLSELQEYALRLREELIAVSVGREAALGAEEALRSELLVQGGLVRKHIAAHQHLQHQHKQLRQQLELLETDRQQLKSLGEQLRTNEARLHASTEERRKLSEQVGELRARVSSLQQDLDNSEKVQQDFVRLSQSLQVQLERIREADTEVRWQHDEDISECPACHQHLPQHKKKMHCLHCGRIFCPACLSHTVLSGPRQAPSRVCTVCHTLLERNTAPYFSTEAPHTPD